MRRIPANPYGLSHEWLEPCFLVAIVDGPCYRFAKFTFQLEFALFSAAGNLIAMELEMSLQYLLVNFDGSRGVLANDVPVGVTNRILLIASQDVTVVSTTVVTPAVVTFS